MIDEKLLADLVRIYKVPSQTLWRYVEVRCLKHFNMERPILEIGCGTGRLSALILDRIDVGIDLNSRSVEKAQSATGALGKTYARVLTCDARELPAELGKFRTVFANCVLEHIPNLDRVLAGCRKAVDVEGRLFATVPLARMNDHLAFSSKTYADLRAQQLSHLNLWTEEEWERQLLTAGFAVERIIPYLGPSQCEVWDRLDIAACVGVGRAKIGPVFGRLLNVLPSRVRQSVLNWSTSLVRSHVDDQQLLTAPCAALIIAKPI